MRQSLLTTLASSITMVVTVTVDMMNARIASVAKKESGNKVWIKLLYDVK